MEFESQGLSKEEIRRQRRKKERMQAIMILSAAVLVVLLIVVGVITGIVKAVSVDKEKKEDKQIVDAVVAETVVEQDIEEVEQEETLDQEVATEQEDESVEAEAQESEAEESESGDSDVEAEESEESEIDALLDGGLDEAALEELVNEQIASMTLEQKVAGLFFVTPAQLMGVERDISAVGSEFGQKMSEYPVGGILLDVSNMTEGELFQTMVPDISMYAPKDIFYGIENEGGEDAPFVSSGLSENVISSYKEIATELGEAGAYSAGISLGSELRQYGFNVNFAPNVDVSLKTGSAAETDGFGTDMNTTSELGKNLVKGLSDQGIFATVKHFPSYGDVTQDGSGGTVISQRTKDDLINESMPYREAIDSGAKFVMVSHISLPRVRGDNRPASLSTEVITDIIRTEWGYDGIVITDYMNKSCMYQKYTYAEAAVGAIEAGADMILSPKNFIKSYNGVLDAVRAGTLTEERINESLKRIYRVKYASKATKS